MEKTRVCLRTNVAAASDNPGAFFLGSLGPKRWSKANKTKTENVFYVWKDKQNRQVLIDWQKIISSNLITTFWNFDSSIIMKKCLNLVQK